MGYRFFRKSDISVPLLFKSVRATGHQNLVKESNSGTGDLS
ncbi:hypothetical protein SAMN05518861_13825 [Mesorhizobium sp. YR577]|nr:hypothetical protein SAMN05518861_13825 [Mesorhizobium sp. YR577]